MAVYASVHLIILGIITVAITVTESMDYQRYFYFSTILCIKQVPRMVYIHHTHFIRYVSISMVCKYIHYLRNFVSIFDDATLFSIVFNTVIIMAGSITIIINYTSVQHHIINIFKSILVIDKITILSIYFNMRWLPVSLFFGMVCNVFSRFIESYRWCSSDHIGYVSNWF